MRYASPSKNTDIQDIPLPKVRNGVSCFLLCHSNVVIQDWTCDKRHMTLCLKLLLFFHLLINVLVQQVVKFACLFNGMIDHVTSLSGTAHSQFSNILNIKSSFSEECYFCWNPSLVATLLVHYNILLYEFSEHVWYIISIVT